MSSHLRIRALILAAGYGTRLKPLSLFLPKPLLPVGTRPIVESTLERLAEVGCEKIFFNLHYLGDRIRDYFGESYRSVPIGYSHEETIQGTAGALHPLRDELCQADLILLANGDTLCRWPWREMIDSHLESRADATLLLHDRVPDRAIGGGVGVNADGNVVQFRAERPVDEIARRHLFAGAHALSPRLLKRVRKGPGDIISELYVPLLVGGGRIGSVVTAEQWHDLGTPERYLEANLDWIRSRNQGRSVVSPEARIDTAATIQRSAVGPRAAIEAGARIDSSVLLQDVRVPAKSVLEHVIVGPGVDLPAPVEIRHRLVTRDPRFGRDSVDKRLVYTPLE